MKLPARVIASPPSPRRRAFSLVEILIVVVILGILAAIAVPKFSNASLISRENTLKEDLRFLRTQINVYCTHHTDVFPGYPAGDTAQTPTADIFVQQLTQYTDNAGNTGPSSATYKWGPYLTKMPENPVNGFESLTASLKRTQRQVSHSETRAGSAAAMPSRPKRAGLPGGRGRNKK